MIDIRKLKELVRLMVENDLIEMDLRDAQEQVTVRRPGPQQAPQVFAAPVAHVPAAVHAAPAVPSTAQHSAAPAAAPPSADDKLHAVLSPMVGTFYAAASPDAPAFADVGTKVGPNTVICLIEAMKIFNEIKAETAGTVRKVLVKNGESVEFGQKLMLIEPDNA
ncbi:MAG TPA: acetyl-CoA carboxylase biotin carboxyl carrier protein [Phycisphaerales bacterium]|nr:acetyl-CoA carboxylase biotin carboxyl carrier protein [Phycisphaerales bacterium]